MNNIDKLRAANATIAALESQLAEANARAEAAETALAKLEADRSDFVAIHRDLADEQRAIDLGRLEAAEARESRLREALDNALAAWAAAWLRIEKALEIRAAAHPDHSHPSRDECGARAETKE